MRREIMPTTTRRPFRLLAMMTVAWLVLALIVLVAAPAGSVRAADPTPTPTPARPRTPVATLVPRPTPTATPGVTQLGTNVTFHGRGWGHGVGLSQYGARGRALAGQTAETILAHYYAGAALGSVPLDTTIRVRVLAGYRASATALELRALGGTWTIDGVATTFPAGARIFVTPTTSGASTTWRYKVVSAAGSVLRDVAATGFRMRPAATATLLQVWSRTSSYDQYRGGLNVHLDANAPTLNVVNELPLETYLRGVVPAEMPASWPVEALEAQAVAARSYAARRLRPGVSYYDVNDDTSSQVYLGKEGEKAQTDAVIAATAGIVLRSGSSIANTLFHSTGGGATEHNENVFVSSTGGKVAGPVSYLRGRPDRAPNGTSYDAGAPYETWKTATYARSQLSSWFASDHRTNVGSLTALDLRDRGVSGRLISVTLIGSLGTKRVSGDIFRAVFNARRPAGDPSMRSNLVDTRPIP